MAPFPGKPAWYRDISVVIIRSLRRVKNCLTFFMGACPSARNRSALSDTQTSFGHDHIRVNLVTGRRKGTKEPVCHAKSAPAPQLGQIPRARSVAGRSRRRRAASRAGCGHRSVWRCKGKDIAIKSCSLWSGIRGPTLCMSGGGGFGGSGHELVSRMELARICGDPAHGGLRRVLAAARVAHEHPARHRARRGRSPGSPSGTGTGEEGSRTRGRTGQAGGGCRYARGRPADRIERRRDRDGFGAADAARGSCADEIVGLSQPQLYDQRHTLSRRGNARIPCARL